MIAIKDMEMPGCCAECYTQGLLRVVDCTLFNDCHCLIERHHDCPLVEIEERKVGKWIYDKAFQNWRCSECNETPKTIGYVGTADFMAEHFQFCNHCGAEMKGAEDGN